MIGDLKAVQDAFFQLQGLESRAGCIFSLLLNAFEWCLRFKI
jgi:hypothetical protein